MELPPLSAEEAESIHRLVMQEYPEEPSGVLDRGLLESALLRPAYAAEREDADECVQAATLLWGLVRNHAFVQGDKRTASAITFFLETAGYAVEGPDEAVLDIVYAIDSGDARVDDVATWFRRYTIAPG